MQSVRQVASVDFGSGVESAWTDVATFVPRLVGFLVILAVTFIVARVLRKAVDTLLERVGFDNAVERGGIKQALATSKYDASDVVATLAYYAVVLIGLSMAFGTFGPNPISAYLASIVAFIPKVIVAIVIVALTGFLAKTASDLLSNTLGGLSYGPVLGKVVAGAVWFFGAIAALDQIQVARAVTLPIEVALLATLSGIAIVGVGGGLVQPMRTRWEQALTRVSEETQVVREQVQAQARTEYADEPYPTSTGLDAELEAESARTQRLRASTGSSRSSSRSSSRRRPTPR